MKIINRLTYLVLIGFAFTVLNITCLASTNVFGLVMATVIGPNESTPETEVKSPHMPESIRVFLLTLKVVNVGTNALNDLKGQTIKVPTTRFSKEFLGETVPLCVVYLGQPDQYGQRCHFHCTDFKSAYYEGLGYGRFQGEDAGPWAETGLVFAKILGPSHSTIETATTSPGAGSAPYFWTTVEITDTVNVAMELTGQRIQLRTVEFDPKLIGKTVPLRLTRSHGKDGKRSYSLESSDLNFSYRWGKSVLNSTN